METLNDITFITFFQVAEKCLAVMAIHSLSHILIWYQKFTDSLEPIISTRSSQITFCQEFVCLFTHSIFRPTSTMPLLQNVLQQKISGMHGNERADQLAKDMAGLNGQVPD